jgi:SAM-dependent methyltransferase
MVFERPCPVCGAPASAAKLFIEENIDSSRISDFTFASRKQPEYMCHRLVQCPSCDLVYVPQPPAQDELAAEYHRAAYDSSEEGNDAANSYLKAIEPIIAQLSQRHSALEIGTGTGVFLESLRSVGFENLVGIEPSESAIAAAPESRRAWIREGIFNAADFESASFDLICCFMTMEHVADPGYIAHSALRLLKPGGAFVTVTHDYRSWVNKLLGKKSPIIDIEHMQLFSERSITELFRINNFKRINVRRFSNSYALRYWVRLAPVPGKIKAALLSLLEGTGVAKSKLSFNVGNSIAAGFKES